MRSFLWLLLACTGGIYAESDVQQPSSPSVWPQVQDAGGVTLVSQVTTSSRRGFLAQDPAGGEEHDADDQGAAVEFYKTMAIASLVVSSIALVVSIAAIAYVCRLVGMTVGMRIQDSKTGDNKKLGMPTVEMMESSGGQEFLSFCDPEPSTASGKRSSIAQSSQAGGGSNDLTGSWECIETWGLDEFLTAMKVSRIRRMAAMKAPWPSWQWTQNGDTFMYVNKSKFGVMKENFTADRTPYEITDLEKNTMTCKAYWKNGKLVIERQNSEKRVWEHRHVNAKGELEFELEMEGLGVKWGRKFRRA